MLGEIAKELKVPLCTYRVSCAYGFNKFCPDQGVLNKWIFDGLLYGQINLYNCLDSELNFISYHQISNAFDLGIKLRLNGLFNISTSGSTSLRQIYNWFSIRFRHKDQHIRHKKRSLNIDCPNLKLRQDVNLSQN